MTSIARIAARHGRQPAVNRAALPRIIRMEWIKLRSLRSTACTLAVALILVVGLGALIQSGSRRRCPGRSRRAPDG